MIVDQENFDAKLAVLKERGLQGLHIISDFDNTLILGKTTHALIETAPGLSDKYKFETNRLLDFYLPLEVAADMTTEQKIPYMLDWYEKAHNLMLTEGVTKNQLLEAVKTKDVWFRPKVAEFFDFTKQHNIPVMIFSAGVATIIEMLMDRFSLLDHSLIKIVGNFINFDKDGSAKSFSEPLVHMFNKNETVATESIDPEYMKELAKRKCVILLGDGLGDVHMSDGLHKHDVILKIGFYEHEDHGERLEQFKQVYDVILFDQSDFQYILDLLSSL